MAEPEGVVTVASNFEVSYAANRQISISKVQHDDVPIFGINQKFQMVVETLRDFVCALDFWVENIDFPQKTIDAELNKPPNVCEILKVRSTECKAQLQVPNLSNFIEDNISKMEILSNKLSEDEI
jgi:hypothetical protein